MQGNGIMVPVSLKDIDRRIWEEELAEFVPQQLFDMHTHIYEMHEESQDESWGSYPLSNWDMLNQADQLLFPYRVVHRLCFGNPLQQCPLDEANDMVAKEVKNDPKSRAFMLVRPDISVRTLTQYIEKNEFLGFKPYRTHSITGDSVNCRITDFLPEEQIEVADHYGMMIMLHVSKRKAIADTDNLNDLEYLTTKYDRVRWILAHCARSYYDGPLLQAYDRLKRLNNVWYEISSVCDTDAMDVLLSIAGSGKVMYGSDDLPVGITRGKYIHYGFAWTELNEKNNSLNVTHCEPEMTFVRYENLRALRRACRRQGYGKCEIEKIFHSNAEHLLGLEEIDIR